MWVYKIFPIRITYSDNMKEGTGGYFTGLLFSWRIMIRTKYKDDQGILMHELTHAKQHIRFFGMFLFFYVRSRKVRLRSEVEAYREQLKYFPALKDPEWYRKLYAEFLLSDRYDLKITYEEALAMLK